MPPQNLGKDKRTLGKPRQTVYDKFIGFEGGIGFKYCLKKQRMKVRDERATTLQLPASKSTVEKQLLDCYQ